MHSEEPAVIGEHPGVEHGSPSVFDPLRTALSRADESERSRLLAGFFAEVAELYRNGADRTGGSAEQLTSLTRKVQELEKKRADLEDLLRSARADLGHREKQLEAERARSQEIQEISTGQRSRLEAVEAQIQKLEAELANRNSDLHRLESANESLTVRLQRAELAAGDTRHTDHLEENKRELAEQLQAMQASMADLRNEKNAEIERLQAELSATQKVSSGSADALLASMWQRLASAKPSLVTDAHVQPTAQAAERLVDAFIELAAFAQKLDHDMRPNLDGFTKTNQEVRKLWAVYKEQCDLYQIIRQTIAPTQGRHVGALKMQLKVCRNWAFAALVSCDSTIEWIAAELRTHLLGPAGAGTNAKCTVKDYLRDSGPDAFLEHMRKLRSDKLAEIYGSGA